MFPVMDSISCKANFSSVSGVDGVCVCVFKKRSGQPHFEKKWLQGRLCLK